MNDNFDLYDIYEQNLNFLFGAGASFGFLPTLALKIKDTKGLSYTFETLAKELDDSNKVNLYNLLFMHYYKTCIHTGLPRTLSAPLPPNRIAVLDEYKRFLKTLLTALEKQNRNSKKANIYTTNYDNCLEVSSDELISDQSINCTINDGSEGFQSRKFHTKNFNNRIVQRGIFDNHDEYLPQINILHAHGSVYWGKCEQGIEVNYSQTNYDITFDECQNELLSRFSEIVNNEDKSLVDLVNFESFQNWDDFSAGDFWDKYNRIPIVNPTKWKFHETVFEEAYYQILRHLSFELERPNTVLITFGFSFADEHILHLVQRSLSNPTLTVYISCFNEIEKQVLKKKFIKNKNVKFVCIDEDLNFKRFNNRVFTLKKDNM
ncbi:MAG: hypothetical protein ACMZ64_07655 [Oleiphilus sp.]